MKTWFQLLSWLGLALTVVPAVLVFAGTIAWATHARLMFVGMILWFLTAPVGIKRKA
jgi:hypothetical protein